MRVKIKKIGEKVKTPEYSTDGAAGIDFYAHGIRYVYQESKHQYSLDKLKYLEYNTGIAVEIPIGFVGLMFPRSSITNKDLFLGNAVGVIDSDYRGEITFRFKRTDQFTTDEYKIGEKIGQLVIVPAPKVVLEEVNELSDTVRSLGGYGSTGR
jgi:dUTP pyrophosphatase